MKLNGNDGKEISIILICSERRSFGSNILNKLFSIGIYNALIGNDRSMDNLCKLINRPRTKKEAKIYYRIDQATYESAPNSGEVSENEIQNILNHFKKLGKNTDRYTDSFNNIAAQYTDDQLKIIINVLPIKVKAVLEAESNKYQSIMGTPKESANKKIIVPNDLGIKINTIGKSGGNNIKGPIVIPSSIKKISDIERKTINNKNIQHNSNQKNTNINSNNQVKNYSSSNINQRNNDINGKELSKVVVSQNVDNNIKNNKENNNTENVNSEKNNSTQRYTGNITQIKKRIIKVKNIGFQNNDNTQKIDSNISEKIQNVEQKRGRGRPKKPVAEQEINEKGKRGRPRKNPSEDENNLQELLVGLESNNQSNEKELSNLDNINNINSEDVLLPGLDEIDNNENEEDGLLPGLDEIDNNENEEIDVNNLLAGLDDDLNNDKNSSFLNKEDNNFSKFNNNELNENIKYGKISTDTSNAIESIKPQINYSMSNLNSLLSKDKKIVSFIGATKNGTSFLINNLALMFSMMGIDTAILDMTQNKNSYYLFTDSKEELRKIAYTSLSKLENGYAEGIKFNKNLTVYTGLPSDGIVYENAEPILSTLVQNHSLILIDTDFNTPPSYFASCQEIYLVQSMDILTIQPLTAFLRELKFKGAWEPEKVRVVINKEIPIRILSNKTIIGGMSRYNGPDMSVMTDLFNKDMVKACSIPFDEKVYAKYLETLATCKLSISSYPKQFRSKLEILAEMVYPRLNGKTNYSPFQKKNNIEYYSQSNTFSNDTNNTLNKMKKNKF